MCKSRRAPRGAHPSGGARRSGLRALALLAILAAYPARAAGAGTCTTCHVGAEVLGAQVYLELACAFCHGTVAGTPSSPPLGPPLVAPAAAGWERMVSVIRAPHTLYPGTVMPGYAEILDRAPERATALLIYLHGLEQASRGPGPSGDAADPPGEGARLGSQPRASSLSEAKGAQVACTSCHLPSGARRVAAEARAHTCPLLTSARAELTCARCHGASPLPRAEGPAVECLYLRERRRDCGVCHSGAIDE